MQKDLKTVIFGAGGMVGRGVLQACLDDADVSQVLAVGRSHCGVTHPKLRELLHQDFYDYSSVAEQLRGYNACFFALGTTSAGKNEAEYTRVTYDLTMAAAQALLKENPGMSFGFVTGQGTDSSGQGRIMWARIKGRAENALLAMDFKPATMFRPGIIEPLPGVLSKTPLYNYFIVVARPLFPFLVRHFPGSVTTTLRIGRAMIKAARGESAKRVLEPGDINALAGPTA